MIELIDNIVQFSVTFLLFCCTGVLAMKHRNMEYVLATCFYGCFSLAGVFWTLYQVVMQKTPAFVGSDLTWVAAYLFLFLLERYLASPEEEKFRHPLMLLPLAVGVALIFYFCQRGDYLSNITWIGLIALDTCLATRGLLFAKNRKKRSLPPGCTLRCSRLHWRNTRSGFLLCSGWGTH